MKNMFVFFALLLFAAIQGQNVRYYDLQYKNRVGCNSLLLGGDKDNLYYFEYAGPGYNPKIAATILRYNRAEKVKEKQFLRTNVSFSHSKVFRIVAGRYVNNTISIYYTARLDDEKKIALLAAEYDMEATLLRTVVLYRVMKQQELDKVQLFFSPDKQVIACFYPGNFVLYDMHYKEIYNKTVNFTIVSDINITNKGELAFIGNLGGILHLGRFTTTGDYMQIKIEMDEKICDAYLKIVDENTLGLCKIIGSTQNSLAEIQEKYELNNEAKGIIYSSFTIDKLEQTELVTEMFNEQITETMGIRNQHIKWLSVDNIYKINGSTYIFLQKRYKKNLALNSKEEEEYKVAEDLLIIKISDNNLVMQKTYENHVMKNNSQPDYVISPLFLQHNNRNVLFYYNTKVTAGEYKYEIVYGVLNSDLEMGNKVSYAMDAKRIMLDFSCVIPLTENSYLFPAYREKENKIGTAFLEF